MATRPPERLIDSFTLYTADGAPVVVHRWTNPTLARGEWFEDGPPANLANTSFTHMVR